MRNTTLAMTVALALVAGKLQAAPPKSPPADVGPGRIAWFDITSNLPQSKEFYGKLFDWSFTPVQGSDQAVEIVARGEAIGTLRVAEGKISPFNGVIYVWPPVYGQPRGISCRDRKAWGLPPVRCPPYASCSRESAGSRDIPTHDATVWGAVVSTVIVFGTAPIAFTEWWRHLAARLAGG